MKMGTILSPWRQDGAQEIAAMAAEPMVTADPAIGAIERNYSFLIQEDGVKRQLAHLV
jgi:hypothetical protein